MFDEIIYKILDKIVSWCERYKVQNKKDFDKVNL